MPRKEFWTNGVLVNVIEPTPEEAEAERVAAIQKQITDLEATITNRRIREAQMTGDMTFISGVDAQIAVLRGQL